MRHAIRWTITALAIVLAFAVMTFLDGWHALRPRPSTLELIVEVPSPALPEARALVANRLRFARVDVEQGRLHVVLAPGISREHLEKVWRRLAAPVRPGESDGEWLRSAWPELRVKMPPQAALVSWPPDPGISAPDQETAAHVTRLLRPVLPEWLEAQVEEYRLRWFVRPAFRPGSPVPAQVRLLNDRTIPLRYVTSTHRNGSAFTIPEFLEGERIRALPTTSGFLFELGRGRRYEREASVVFVEGEPPAATWYDARWVGGSLVHPSTWTEDNGNGDTRFEFQAWRRCGTGYLLFRETAYSEYFTPDFEVAWALIRGVSPNGFCERTGT